jgi:3-oxosteroid 1-dehydrogenase
MTFDKTYDVVVLGSGAAGASTAAVAAGCGLNVLLLEKADVFGGGTTYSYGAVWLGMDPYSQREAEVVERSAEIEAAVEYLAFLSAGAVPRTDLTRYVKRSIWAMRLLHTHGLELQPSKMIPDHYYPVAPGSKAAGHVYCAPLFRAADLGTLAGSLGRSPYVPTGLTWDEAISWGGLTDDEHWDHALIESRRRNGDHRGFGMGLAGHLLHACIKAGVVLQGSCAAQRLIVEDGTVVGVEVARRDEQAGPIRIGARRAVVIATGGVEGNHEFVRKFEDLPDWHTHFPPDVTGDGVLMALQVGAALIRAPHNLRVMLGFKLATPEGGRHFRSAGIREAAAPHTLVVNYRGERFGDESSFQYMVNEIKRMNVETHTFSNYPCFLVMDQQFFERYSFAGRPKGSAAPGWLARAETLEDLAEALGIDSAAFAKTVAEFNGFAEVGDDPKFGRGRAPFANVMGGTHRKGHSQNLGTVRKPPFYGVPLIPTGISSVSLQISARGAVLDNYGAEIAGLYACGNAARDIDAGPGYQAGISHAQGMTMGCTIGAFLGGEAEDAS